MRGNILGIDPGQKGAFALITPEGDALEAVTMPESVWAIGDEIARLAPAFITLEKAQAMPKNGACSMFSYGVGFGMIQGVISALNIPFTLIEPKRWTRAMHVGCVGETAKAKSLQACQRLFPRFELRTVLRFDETKGRVYSKKPHDGIVDALLIAEYARRHLYGKPVETETRVGRVPGDS